MFWDHSLHDLFIKGGFAMYPLLACSILAAAVILDRVAVLSWLGMSFRGFIGRFGPLIAAGEVDKARQLLAGCRAPVARVTAAYLEHLDSPAEVREQAVRLEGSQQLARLERRLNWLAAIGSIATLLGLLGTVTGLVTAFHQIETKAGLVQPGDLAAGIWEALLTTVFGLSIAIPCMAVYYLFDNRVGAVGLQMQWIAMYLEQWLHAARRAGADSREPQRASRARGD